MRTLASRIRNLVVPMLLASIVALALSPSFAEAGVKKILPSDMVPRKSLTDYTATPSYLWHNEGPTIMAFSAPLQLPAGARITKVTLYFKGSGADETWLYLRKVSLAAGSQDALDETLAKAINLTDGTGQVIEMELTFEVGAARKVQKGSTYYLYLQLEGSSTFTGAKVTYKN